MSAKVVLQVISGPIQGKLFEFDTHDTFLFGRSKECHARLPKDGYVSRHHFLLEVNPPAATIRDFGEPQRHARQRGPLRRAEKRLQHGGRPEPGTPDGLEGPRRNHGRKNHDPVPCGCGRAARREPGCSAGTLTYSRAWVNACMRTRPKEKHAYPATPGEGMPARLERMPP